MINAQGNDSPYPGNDSPCPGNETAFPPIPCPVKYTPPSDVTLRQWAEALRMMADGSKPAHYYTLNAIADFLKVTAGRHG